jgi:hypothetical protein
MWSDSWAVAIEGSCISKEAAAANDCSPLLPLPSLLLVQLL